MYFSDEELFYKRNMEERLENNKLLVLEYEVSNGNRCNIYNTNGQAILMGLTLREAYWVVNGICNYQSKFPAFKEV